MILRSGSGIRNKKITDPYPGSGINNPGSATLISKSKKCFAIVQ
jgi:hypothetical protein